jgi:hypothetical protein
VGAVKPKEPSRTVTRGRNRVFTNSVSEDHLFDLLAILVFIVLPLALAPLGLAAAVRSSSLFWRVVGYAAALGGTWIGVTAAVSVAQCPSQDGELCGDQSGVAGDVATQLLVVLALTYALLVIWWRAKSRARSGKNA